MSQPVDLEHPAVLFVCPDDDSPIGGVKVMYRHVDLLNEAGIAAHILHERPAFRCTWFENTTSVVSPLFRQITTHDIVVVPEVYGPRISEIAPGTPKVIYNQNAHLTFENWEIPGRRPGSNPAVSAYNPPEVIGAVTVSEHSRAYLQHVWPEIPIHRVYVNIECPGESSSATTKEDLLLYMPRKNADHASQVLNILVQRDGLSGFEIRAIEGLGHAEVTALMARARVFLSFGYPEGCPLPPLEAMAAGCLVIGYDGGGGQEYLTDDTGYPITFGDTLGFARCVEMVLAEMRADPTEAERRVSAATRLVSATYNAVAERRSVIDAWGHLLDASGHDSVRVDAALPHDHMTSPQLALLRSNEELLHQLRAERDAAVEAATKMRDSTSWRVTRPLRALGALLRTKARGRTSTSELADDGAERSGVRPAAIPPEQPER